jgi:hypothetical protein
VTINAAGRILVAVNPKEGDKPSLKTVEFKELNRLNPGPTLNYVDYEQGKK